MTKHISIHMKAQGPCTPTDIGAALEKAESVALAKGQKLTRIRRKVLTLLLQSTEPAKAYDLLQDLDGEGAAKPPTIYRALDFLQENGLAHKIESLNAYVACGHTGHAHSAFFLICDNCGSAEELHAVSSFEAIQNDAADAQFTLRHATLEAYGTCRACQV